MTTLIDTKMSCPCCDGVFESPVVASSNELGMATDFMPIAGGMPFIPMMIITCPTCGYSTDDMSIDKGTVAQNIKELTLERLAPLVQAKRPSASQSHKFAAMILEWQGAPAVAVADLYLSAAWCCRLGCGDNSSEDEEFFLQEAVERFERSVHNGTIGEYAAKATYLIGELYRRLGDKDRAEEWFKRVPETVDGNGELRWLVDAARQQQSEPKEEWA